MVVTVIAFACRMGQVAHAIMARLDKGKQLLLFSLMPLEGETSVRVFTEMFLMERSVQSASILASSPSFQDGRTAAGGA